MANTYLTRTFGSAGNRKKWTFSAWVKKAVNGVEQRLLTTSDNATFDDQIKFKGADKLEIVCNSGSGVLTTNRLFRDNSAWYHIVAIWDSGNSTSGDRCQLWVNGIRETSFATETYPSINQDGFINNNTPHYIGVTNVTANSHHFNGIMSHIHFIDGTAYDATAFGEYDANGVWTIKTSPSVTYGNNGFFILKDGNSVTDQSGNSNDWTVGGGSVIATQDNPSNNFSRMNALNTQDNGSVFSLGNSRIVTYSSFEAYNVSTFAMSKGKYYMEAKAVEHDAASGLGNFHIGIAERECRTEDQVLGKSDYSWGYNSEDGTYFNSSNYTSFGNTYTTGDIIGLALDLDNNTLAIYKNGVSQGTITITDVEDNGTGSYYFALGENGTANSVTWEANCGNGYFGETAISSAGTNASGNGIFEFDCPTGFTALSTKGLNL